MGDMPATHGSNHTHPGVIGEHVLLRHELVVEVVFDHYWHGGCTVFAAQVRADGQPGLDCHVFELVWVDDYVQL